MDESNLPSYMRISPKKLSGSVYTPSHIVNLILDKIGYINNIINKRIVDPSCGDGSFLVAVTERLIQDALNQRLSQTEIQYLLQENVYGFDIDRNAVNRCISRLNEILIKFDLSPINWNILCLDSLNKEEISRFFQQFDFVVGNPPYVRIQHLGNERRKRIQEEWLFCQSGSTDMFIAFFELGLLLLNGNGKLGYITPNTYFKTITARALREYLIRHKLIKTLIDFGYHQVFEDATTYSAITILDKSVFNEEIELFKWENHNIKFLGKVPVSVFDHDPWVIASLHTLERIKDIETRGYPLGKIAQIHVGITTLADDYYIFQHPKFEGDIAIIKLKDGRQFPIEKKILKPIVKVSVLKKADEDQNRFIVFPYEKVGGKYSIIPEDKLKEAFPLTYAYFDAIKPRLLLRDKGKPNPVAWYAFGRSQGLDTSFGKKILFSGIGQHPRFIVWTKEEYTFYSGYCIKYEGDLEWLANQLNSEDMLFYIKHISRDYQHGYKSFAKSFIMRFGVVDETKKHSFDNEYKQCTLDLSGEILVNAKSVQL